jgi:hypothetical protein
MKEPRYRTLYNPEEFVNDAVFHGLGSYLLTNGKEYIGIWNLGQLESTSKSILIDYTENTRFEGQIIFNAFIENQDLENPKTTRYVGTKIWSDGRRYDGYWLDGKRVSGRHTFKDGSTWTGEWTNDMPNDASIREMFLSESPPPVRAQPPPPPPPPPPLVAEPERQRIGPPTNIHMEIGGKVNRVWSDDTQYVKIYYKEAAPNWNSWSPQNQILYQLETYVLNKQTHMFERKSTQVQFQSHGDSRVTYFKPRLYRDYSISDYQFRIRSMSHKANAFDRDFKLKPRIEELEKNFYANEKELMQYLDVSEWQVVPHPQTNWYWILSLLAMLLCAAIAFLNFGGVRGRKRKTKKKGTQMKERQSPQDSKMTSFVTYLKSLLDASGVTLTKERVFNYIQHNEHLSTQEKEELNSYKDYTYTELLRVIKQLDLVETILAINPIDIMATIFDIVKSTVKSVYKNVADFLSNIFTPSEYSDDSDDSDENPFGYGTRKSKRKVNYYRKSK